MLPASDLAEIIANLTALKLGPDTTAAVLSAVVAPLLRSLDPNSDPVPKRRRERAGRPRSRAAPRRRYKRRAPGPTEARERARAALQANPDATVSAIAEIAKVSRATVVKAAADLARESRRKPGAKRKGARESKPTGDAKIERRERAQQFLKATLARGPRSVSDIEEAAAKAHVEHHTLEQARAELGVITSRADSGAHAVQWSLPPG